MSKKAAAEMQRKLDQWKAQPHHRGVSLQVRADDIDEDARTVALSFSSEAEVGRWFGVEVLGHGEDEVDMTRFENGAAVLVGHDHNDHVGVIERAWIDDTTGRANVRFGNSERASEIFRDVVDGIRRHISVGYFVQEMKLIEEREDGPDVFRVNRWQPFELSFVAVPADISVGVGRTVALNVEGDGNSVSEEMLERALLRALEKSQTSEERQMEKNTPPAPNPGAADPAAPTPDVRAIEDKAREDARQAERERVSELLQTGEAYGAQELARECINNGESVHDLNRKILERGGMKATTAEDPNIGLTEREVRKFRFTRLLNAMFEPNDREAQEAAAFELECARAAEQQLRKPAHGMVVPYDVLSAKRAMSVGTAASGGDLVETELLEESFIDKLENRMALIACGVTHLPGLNGNIAIPRQTGGASHFWLAEDGAPTESSATFDQVSLTPKTVGAFTEISRRLLLQSSVRVEDFVANELALRLALAIDLAGINGSGASNQPTGILNAAGVGVTAIGTNGGAPTWDHIVDMESGVADSNADVGSLCYLTNAKVRGKLKKTKVDAGSGEFVWDRRAGDTPLNGYRSVVSNQVPKNLTKGTGTNLSALLYGNFADLIIGMWGGLDLQVNPYSLDTKGAVRVTSFQDIDVAVRHAESFNVIKDADTQ